MSDSCNCNWNNNCPCEDDHNEAAIRLLRDAIKDICEGLEDIEKGTCKVKEGLRDLEKVICLLK